MNANPKLVIYRPGKNFGVPSYPESPQVAESFRIVKSRTIPEDADLVYVDSSITAVADCPVPYVVLVGGNWWWELRNRQPKLERVVYTLKRARMVLCLSKFLADFVRSKLGTDNVTHLPGGLWGTDHVRFKVNPKRFRPKKRYDFAGRPVISMGISMVGDIKYRGIGMFLEAARKVIKRHDARVVCSGRLVGNSKLVNMWRDKYGLEYVNWKRDADFTQGDGDREWPRLLHQSDVFVHPSMWDAWGCVVADAMFTGVPSIVFRGTGSEEIGAGYVKVAPTDKAGIAMHLDHLLSNQVAREAMGRQLVVEANEKNREHRNDFRLKLLEALR